jgi:hypothetical protein
MAFWERYVHYREPLRATLWVLAVCLVPAFELQAKPCPPPEASAEGGTAVTTPCGQKSYSTNFPKNETPISENGNWTNTISRTFNAPVTTQNGHAIGPTSSGFNDSIAMLVGDYGRDQTATGTAYRGGSSGPAEIELLLRMNLIPGSPDKVNLYEVDMIPSQRVINLVKWYGSQQTVVNIASVTLDSVNDGDVFTASAIGPRDNTVFTIKKNGVVLLTHTEHDAFDTGNPGIGLDAGNPSDGANLGWKSYSVTTSN